MSFAINVTVEMKKPHACGGQEMRIIRTGADIKVECLNCHTRIMMPRHEFERKIKKIINNPLQVD